MANNGNSGDNADGTVRDGLHSGGSAPTEFIKGGPTGAPRKKAGSLESWDNEGGGLPPSGDARTSQSDHSHPEPDARAERRL